MSNACTNAAMPLEHTILACDKALFQIEKWRNKAKARLIAKTRKGYMFQWFNKKATDEEVWNGISSWDRSDIDSVGWRLEQTASQIRALGLAALNSGQKFINISAEDFARLQKYWPGG